MYKIESRQENRPYPLGVTTTEFGYTYFSVVMKNGHDCGIVLYDKRTGKETRIPFSEQNKYGSIYSIAVKDLDINRYSYNFYDGDRVFTDPYVKLLHGHDKWGKCEELLKGGFIRPGYDWQGDKPLKIPYEESVLYCLNVRAFTKHKSSGVPHKGTFRGLTEKIPYLKELGITAVELMPAYEFDELESGNKKWPSGKRLPPLTMEEAKSRLAEKTEEEAEGKPPKEKYNCWGYTESFYFAPKSAFAADHDTVKEFKDMVKELHRSGIEVIMQFYFPHSVKMGMMLDALGYWVLEYHIDGFHLKGDRIPLQGIATEPLLTDTKLFYYDFPYGQIYEENEIPGYRNLGNYNDDYMYTVRSFLKGDEGMVGKFLDLQRKNPSVCGTVNYLTNYYGFTLADMVSYEKKHNEENGEQNMDGSDYNLTWNCGAEGASRKKYVTDLRKKQMKNGLSMLFLAQGTPLIYSGDEFGNTRYGNNNPYCQDNETGWVKWNKNALGKEISSYVKKLIALRKRHPILHNVKELKILDYIGCGYPDLSYHGEEAWRVDFGRDSRFAGVMYCGCYAQKDNGEEDDFLYIAYNMYWLPHTFALPKLPRGLKWCLLADTGTSEGIMEEPEYAGTEEPKQQAKAEPRTVQIYISKQEEGAKKDARRNYIKSAF